MIKWIMGYAAGFMLAMCFAGPPAFTQSCDLDLTTGELYLPTEACSRWTSIGQTYQSLGTADNCLVINTGGADFDVRSYYEQKPPILNIQDPWTIEFEVKVVSNQCKPGPIDDPNMYAEYASCQVHFSIGGERRGNILVLFPDRVKVWNAIGSACGDTTIDNTTNYQQYRIIVNIAADNFDVWHNDPVKGWGIIFEDAPLFNWEPSSDQLPWLIWGDLNRVSKGESHWRYFFHDGYSGLLTVDNSNDDGPGSLRHAINCANQCPGPNTIKFAVDGTISLASQLPMIQDDYTTILGGTAPGGPRSVVIDGSSLSDYCLSLLSNNNVLYNLVIDNIQILGDENEISGCYIGIEHDGATRYPGPTDYGVTVNGNNNRIGGYEGNHNVIAGNVAAIYVENRDPLLTGNIISGNHIGVTHIGNAPLNCIGCSDRMPTGIDASNVISTAINSNIIGDCQTAIRLGGDGANQVIGNLVGLDVSRTTAIPNGTGILDKGVNTGSIAFDVIMFNVISGNDEYGISVDGRQVAILINGIGVNYYMWNPMISMPNGAGGIYLNPGISCEIGDNTIAYNGGPGIAVSNEVDGDGLPSRENLFIRNIIHDNGGLGIDLGDDGVTVNDPGDVDDGPNDLLNFPEISSAQVEGSNLRIIGTAPPDARIDYYEAAEDGSPIVPEGEHGEASRYLGSADAASDGEINHLITGISIPVKITATATDLSGNTSEFSKNVMVGTSLSATGYSPISMMISDPDGLQFGLDADGNLINEIPGAEYHTEPHDSIYIPSVKIGLYTISYVRDIGDPDPSTTYSSALKIAGLPQLMVTVDKEVPEPGVEDIFTYVYETGYHYPNGDGNRDGYINIADVVFVVNYFYYGGDPPDPFFAGDANCDLIVNIDDAVKVINYIFKSGEAPCYFEP